ncbi:MAG: hypothetical protein CVU89_04115 [Firmicutes bacterium HGW-Firmicutes-14]|nr:MAG: hypothetical protein CVU89_04115 [Firmicutes bacterium HGW-Firmicutes-14]
MLAEYTFWGLKTIFPILILVFSTIVYVKLKKRWLNKVQWSIIIENPGLASSVTFPVRCSVDTQGLFKLLLIKISGFLSVNNRGLVFLGIESSNVPVNMSFSTTDSEIAWLGRISILSPSHWFSVKTGDKTYYFTVETGKLMPANESQSRACYEKLKEFLN